MVQFQPFHVGKLVFKSKAEFVRRCKEAIHKGSIDSVMSGEDEVLAEAIFNTRLDKVSELNGRSVLRYWRKPHKFNTVSFWAEMSDGEFLDFSFMKLTLPLR